MHALIGLLLLAQQAGTPVAAYTTFDPDTSLGLATPDGRYAIALDPACPLVALADVAVWPSSDGPGYLTFSVADGGTQGCPILGMRRISDVPCFTDDLGRCEVAEDHN